MDERHTRYEVYLSLILTELREDALQAKAMRERFRNTELEAWHAGQLRAYQHIIHLVKSQAEVWDIPVQDLGLGSINPETDLL